MLLLHEHSKLLTYVRITLNYALVTDFVIVVVVDIVIVVIVIFIVSPAPYSLKFLISLTGSNRGVESCIC